MAIPLLSNHKCSIFLQAKFQIDAAEFLRNMKGERGDRGQIGLTGRRGEKGESVGIFLL